MTPRWFNHVVCFMIIFSTGIPCLQKDEPPCFILDSNPSQSDLLSGRSTVPWRKRRSWAFDKTENGPKVGARMVITTPWKFSVPPLKRSKEPQKETIIFPTRFFRGCLGLGVHWWKVLQWKWIEMMVSSLGLGYFFWTILRRFIPLAKLWL